jgi:hypothetical protein
MKLEIESYFDRLCLACATASQASGIPSHDRGTGKKGAFQMKMTAQAPTLKEYIQGRIAHWEDKYKLDRELKADPYHSVGVIKELEKIYKRME